MNTKHFISNNQFVVKEFRNHSKVQAYIGQVCWYWNVENIGSLGSRHYRKKKIPQLLFNFMLQFAVDALVIMTILS